MEEKKIIVADSLDQLISIDYDKSESDHKKHNSPPASITTMNSTFEGNKLDLKRINISSYALEKMFIMAEEVQKIFNSPLEVYALIIGNDLIIHDILIPYQSCSNASVDISVEEISWLIPEIRKHNLNILGWVHSHANFGVFFSGTDQKNQQTLLADTSNYALCENLQVKFVYGITVNIKRDFYANLTVQYPSGTIINNQIDYTIQETKTEKIEIDPIRKEITDELRIKVKSKFHY